MTLAVLMSVLAAKGIWPTPRMCLLPAFVLLAAMTALGAGLWLSAVNARYRDVNHIVPFLVQIWFFSTPIVYPSSLLPDPWRTVYGVNPMVGVVEGFRWSLLGSDATSNPMILVSLCSALALLASGVGYFIRRERFFADFV